MLWGALQALFGIVAAVVAIPAVVDFLQFLYDKIGSGGFWEAIVAMVKAQWHAFVGLFIMVQDLDSFARGEIFGGVLITVILLIAEAVTGLAAAGVELTAAGLLRVLKATGKLGVDAAKDAAATARENVANLYRLGRGAMHGLPHAVEGASELLRGRGLPPEWGEALANGPRKALGHVYEHAGDIARKDVRTFQELAAGAHMRWKGSKPLDGESELAYVSEPKHMADVGDASAELRKIKVVRMTEEEKDTLINALENAQRSTKYDMRELLKTFVKVEGNPEFASFAVSQTGMPYLEVTPKFFNSLTFKGSPDTQELAIIHELVHAEDYIPYAKAGGWTKESAIAYAADNDAALKADRLYLAKNEIRVETEAYDRLMKSRGGKISPRSTRFHERYLERFTEMITEEIERGL